MYVHTFKVFHACCVSDIEERIAIVGYCQPVVSIVYGFVTLPVVLTDLMTNQPQISSSFWLQVTCILSCGQELSIKAPACISETHKLRAIYVCNI